MGTRTCWPRYDKLPLAHSAAGDHFLQKKDPVSWSRVAVLWAIRNKWAGCQGRSLELALNGSLTGVGEIEEAFLHRTLPFELRKCTVLA